MRPLAFLVIFVGSGCAQVLGLEEATLGEGGAGATTSSTGGAGGGACAGVDCDDTNPCTDDLCGEDGECTHPPAELFTVPQQIGDCKERTCDGDTVIDEPDPTDVPVDDGNDCTSETCDGDMPEHPPVTDGAACNEDLPTPGVCAAGVCNSCVDEADCGADTGCADFTCSAASECEVVFQPAGTVLDVNPTEDCMALQCADMNPQPVVAPLITDVDDDGNVCTSDTCTVAGVVEHTPQVGAPCGSPTDDACTNPDTCNGTGTCQPNHEANGFACGSPTNDGCTNPDTCNGTGTCLANHEVNGFACGSATDDECTNPDTCNGTGTCQQNHATDGISCGSAVNNNCTNPDTCSSGTCNPNHETVGTPCSPPAGGTCGFSLPGVCGS